MGLYKAPFGLMVFGWENSGNQLIGRILSCLQVSYSPMSEARKVGSGKVPFSEEVCDFVTQLGCRPTS